MAFRRAGSAVDDGMLARPLLADEAAEDAPRKATVVVARPPIKAFLALILLVNLASSLYLLPVNRVIERRLCREYYDAHDPAGRAVGGGDIDESLCKIDEVQQGLARLQGAMETAWIVGDFVMTIPLGFVAERYGRRAVLCLNLVPRMALPTWAMTVGLFDALLPTRAIVAASFLSVLGGDCLFGSLTYSLAASMTADPVKRASYFGYMSSVSYVVALIGPALSSASMSVVLWLPFCIGIGLLALSVPAIAHLPQGWADDADADADRPLPLLASAFSRLRDDLAAIVASRHPNLRLLLTSFLLTALASCDTKLLTQYISQRYRWTFAAAGYLLSAKAVVNFVLLAVVVPRLLAWRQHQGPASAAASAAAADRDNLHLARLCLAVSVVGATAIALAASIAVLVPALLVYALGSALPVFTLSLLKSPAVVPTVADDNNNTGRAPPHTQQIFAIVMLVKTLGALIGAPTMAAAWVTAIGRGGMALGLPYFVSALCYAAAVGVFARISV